MQSDGVFDTDEPTVNTINARDMARTGTLARASPDGAITVGLRSGQAPDGFSDLVQDRLKALGLVDSSCCIGDSAELVEVVADAA